MMEQDWLACTEPTPMLEFLKGKASDRRLRLFACACCRRIWRGFTHEVCRRAIEVAELHSDGLVTVDELWSAHDDAQRVNMLGHENDATYAAVYAASPDHFEARKGHLPGVNPVRVAKQALQADCSANATTFQVNVIRDIFGNPFRPVTLDATWQTPTVLALAIAAYESRILPAGTLDLTRLAVLADALEEAGCNNADVLNHCRQRGEHVRGCWAVELDLRSLKSAMQMGELRYKTPELVRKEVWTRILAYNLLRTVMAQAAARHGVAPRTISFTGAMQTLEAFQPLLEFSAAQDAVSRLRLYLDLLDAIATHRVGDRPDRYEPRLKKRRRNNYDWLTKPRAEMKRKMAKGVTEN
jgi:hypothetical protein